MGRIRSERRRKRLPTEMLARVTVSSLEKKYPIVIPRTVKRTVRTNRTTIKVRVLKRKMSVKKNIAIDKRRPSCTLTTSIEVINVPSIKEISLVGVQKFLNVASDFRSIMTRVDERRRGMNITSSITKAGNI